MDDDKKLTFPKEERISWKRHLDLLFMQGQSFVVYPLRVIYFPIRKEDVEAEVSIVVSVPKKKFKHAVDRNLLKRRIRESYRTQKHELTEHTTRKDMALLIAFIYISKDKSLFGIIDKAVSKAMRILIQKHE